MTDELTPVPSMTADERLAVVEQNLAQLLESNRFLAEQVKQLYEEQHAIAEVLQQVGSNPFKALRAMMSAGGSD